MLTFYFQTIFILFCFHFPNFGNENKLTIFFDFLIFKKLTNPYFMHFFHNIVYTSYLSHMDKDHYGQSFLPS